MIKRLNTDFAVDGDWVSIGKSKRVSTLDERCYIIRSIDSAKHHDVRLSISHEVGEHIIRMFGEHVSVRLNTTDGSLAIVSGDERKLSRGARNGKRFQLSIGTFHQGIADIFGDYERVYMAPTLYSNAVVLTPIECVEVER